MEVVVENADTKKTKIFRSDEEALGGWINIIGSFLVGLTLGITAVLFPVSLEQLAFSPSAIGVFMSLETVALVLACFWIGFIIKRVGLQQALVLSSLLRIVPFILLFVVGANSLFGVSDNIFWPIVIFTYALGCMIFFQVTATWVGETSCPKNVGLCMAIYSTAISVGLAAGPVIVNLLENHPEVSQQLFAYVSEYVVTAGVTNNTVLGFLISALLSFVTLILSLCPMPAIPQLVIEEKLNIKKPISETKGAMFAMLVGGASYFGVAAFLVIYGIQNGLSLAEAALLLTFFNLGALAIEIPIGWLSDHYDRRYFIVGCSFAVLICAIYLPIAVFVNYQVWALSFLWGGMTASIYSQVMAILCDKYSDENLVAANAGFSLMEAIGGGLAILLVGVSIEIFGSDGFPYVIMLSSILYFCFALTRFRII